MTILTHNSDEWGPNGVVFLDANEAWEFINEMSINDESWSDATPNDCDLVDVPAEIERELIEEIFTNRIWDITRLREWLEEKDYTYTVDRHGAYINPNEEGGQA